MKTKKAAWSQVKALVTALPEKARLDLLRDLYRLSEENRHFILARLAPAPTTIRPYLSEVEDALYPDALRNKPVRLADARRAIVKYHRATGDDAGTLELMIRYVECGTEFTADFGDMDDRFYSSLTTMFEDVVRRIRALPEPQRRPLLQRLETVVHRAGAVGWGYQDGIADILSSVLPEGRS